MDVDSKELPITQYRGGNCNKIRFTQRQVAEVSSTSTAVNNKVEKFRNHHEITNDAAVELNKFKVIAEQFSKETNNYSKLLEHPDIEEVKSKPKKLSRNWTFAYKNHLTRKRLPK